MAARKNHRLSIAQQALLVSLHDEVSHLEHPGAVSIECSMNEKASALALSRRGYLLIHDAPGVDRSFEVFLTAEGIETAMAMTAQVHGSSQ